jgi:hypothetical protein
MLKVEKLYKNTDVLLMDPCFSRDDSRDVDSELYCIDMEVDTWGDCAYYAIKGRLEEMMEKIDEIAETPEEYSYGVVDVETARIGVYDYHKAIEEQPELKERIESKEIVATIIKNFTGTITSTTYDYDDVYVIGKSDDGTQDFFMIGIED